MKHLPIHPRTGQRAIYISPRTGRVFWPIAGASEDNPPADPPPQDPLADPPADPAKGDPPPANPWDALFEGQKPEDVKRAVEESRKWETRAKGNVEKAQQFDALMAVLNPEDPAKADPAKVTADLTAAQAEARATKVENAVLKSAGKHGADATLLTDSRSFMSGIGELDPTADDFAKQVDDRIKAAVEANAAFRAVTGPRPNRQQGNPSQGTEKSLQAGKSLFAETHKTSTTT